MWSYLSLSCPNFVPFNSKSKKKCYPPLVKYEFFMWNQWLHIISDGPVLVYANDGTIASPSIIDASKLTGLYGSASPVTVADLAHFQQVTYMASHVSYTKKSLNFTHNHMISLKITWINLKLLDFTQNHLISLKITWFY